MAGIYIHIPFCKQACTYCNFHFSTSLQQKGQFLTALEKEISLQDDFISQQEKIETIYFGGGTPSLLTNDELKKIFHSLHQKFKIEAGAEITLEANPDDISRDTVKRWMQSGINRLSLGIQSFNDEELRWMNRAHNAQQSLQSIDAIQEAGLHNFSVDLIFGSPYLSDKDLVKNAKTIISKNIPHISCYALTVEPKTMLHKMIKIKKSPEVDAEKQAVQFLMLGDLLEQSGYEQYEISNYAKPGLRSRHNSSYWQGKPYYGFGPSAHSFDGQHKRRWNVANNAVYIQQLLNGQIPFEEELLNREQQLNEYIMTALRTTEGIMPEHVISLFGFDQMRILEKNLQSFINDGRMLINNEGNYALTKEGKLFADGIAAELFF